MLDAYVIEEIKRRESERPRDDRPSIELPLPIAPGGEADEPPPKDRDDGGAAW